MWFRPHYLDFRVWGACQAPWGLPVAHRKVGSRRAEPSPLVHLGGTDRALVRAQNTLPEGRLGEQRGVGSPWFAVRSRIPPWRAAGGLRPACTSLLRPGEPPRLWPFFLVVCSPLGFCLEPQGQPLCSLPPRGSPQPLPAHTPQEPRPCWVLWLWCPCPPSPAQVSLSLS